MAPSERAELAVVERLHAQAEERHPERAPLADSFPRDVLGIGLEEEQCIGPDRQPGPDRREHLFELAGVE